MLRVLRWVLINFSVLGAFIYGSEYGHSGILGFSYLMIGLTILGGIVAFNDKFAENIYKGNPEYKFSVPEPVDVAFDSLFVFALAFYNHEILAFLYLIHIFGSSNLRKCVLELQGKHKRDEEVVESTVKPEFTPPKQSTENDKTTFVEIKD